ncbi:unnamed protein product [marine sediment metagenome]|uniref:Uncharacterized protein n=1 Tax=marine sediment metagenome TaxID=412755 RepID=X1DKC7_9ZZZZ
MSRKKYSNRAAIVDGVRFLMRLQNGSNFWAVAQSTSLGIEQKDVWWSQLTTVLRIVLGLRLEEGLMTQEEYDIEVKTSAGKLTIGYMDSLMP